MEQLENCQLNFCQDVTQFSKVDISVRDARGHFRNTEAWHMDQQAKSSDFYPFQHARSTK